MVLSPCRRRSSSQYCSAQNFDRPYGASGATGWSSGAGVLALPVDRAAGGGVDDPRPRVPAARSTFTVPPTLMPASCAGSATDLRTSIWAARWKIASGLALPTTSETDSASRMSSSASSAPLASLVEVVPFPGGDVVDHDHLVPPLEQCVDEIRADEAGAAGDESLHAAGDSGADRGLRLLWTAARMQPLRREQAVEELDRHRALPDGGGHSLDRTVPDVAGREHPRHARLEEKRTAVERPGAGVRKVGPREDEAVLVAIDLLQQPVGVRADSDHEEEAAGANRLLVSEAQSRSTRCSSHPSPPPPTISV